jgi:hypothetical protein
MSIIQISKIQQRSGNLVDLPQLSDGEFGWAADSKRLFIGKATPDENVEVLTSYSNISFSQVNGSNRGNLNISAAGLGQVLAYDGSNWINAGGAANVGVINLGTASHVKLLGGTNGQYLTTDGAGTLTWAAGSVTGTGGTVVGTDTQIQFSNGAGACASGSLTFTSSTNIFQTVNIVATGNLKVTSNITTPQFISNVATGTAPMLVSSTTLVANLQAALAGSVTANAQGNITSVGTLTALAVTGNVTSGNVYANSGTIGAASLVGTLTINANAQPNVTTVGRLTTLTVGNATANTIFGNGTITAAGNAIVGNISTSGILLVTGNANVGNIGTLHVVSTGNVTAGNVYANSGTVGATTLIGTLSTAIQTNITSVGTLGALTVTGNATAGNVNAGNLLTANYVTGTLTTAAQPNITSTGTLTSLTLSGNITGANVISATTLLGNGYPIININGSNVTGFVGNAAHANVATFADTAGAIAGGNVGGQVANALIAGTVYTAAQPAITSVGTLANLTVTNWANVGSLITANISTPAGTGTLNGSWTVSNLTPTGTVSLGTTGARWSNVFAANASFTGAITTSGLTFDTLTSNSSTVQINAISTDTLLTANSNSTLSTQHAIKTYIDTLVSNEVANITANLNATNTTVAGISGVPVGSIMFIAYNPGITPPPGFLLADGAAYNTAGTYANLYHVIGELYGTGSGQFKVPDLRGQFVRGFDNGRGVDPGRVFGSTQADDFKSHTHSMKNNPLQAGSRDTSNATDAGAGTAILTGATGGTETRPKNIAMCGIIKY